MVDRVSPLNCYYGGTYRVLPVHNVIEISERVEVPAAPQIVWDVLSDPRAVVDCMPGVKLGERLEDGSYDATLTVKFGPAKVTFRAKVALELDGTAMIGHVSSRGKDDQGGTRVKTAMTFKVVAGQAPGSSVVPIDAQVEISGRLASLVESGADAGGQAHDGRIHGAARRALRQGDRVERAASNEKEMRDASESPRCADTTSLRASIFVDSRHHASRVSRITHYLSRR